MFLKIELLVDTEDPKGLASALNSLFDLKKARYTIYEKGKIKDNLSDYCIKCEPYQVEL